MSSRNLMISCKGFLVSLSFFSLLCLGFLVPSALADPYPGFISLTWHYDYYFQDDNAPDNFLSIELREWYNINITEGGGSGIRQIYVQGAYNPMAPGSENTFAIDVVNATGKFYNNQGSLSCEVKTSQVGSFFDPQLYLISSVYDWVVGYPEIRTTWISSSILDFTCADPPGLIADGLNFWIESGMPNIVDMSYDELHMCLVNKTCSYQFSTSAATVFPTAIETIATTVNVEFSIGEHLTLPPLPESAKILPNSIYHLLLHTSKPKP